MDVNNGREVGTAVWEYAHGDHGVILSRDPNLARQHPADYVTGAETTIKKALAQAKRAVKSFKAEQIIGIGVDTTGSTPIPVDRGGQPLAFDKGYTIGLDYGTNSVRTLIVNVANGTEVGTAVWELRTRRRTA